MVNAPPRRQKIPNAMAQGHRQGNVAFEITDFMLGLGKNTSFLVWDLGLGNSSLPNVV